MRWKRRGGSAEGAAASGGRGETVVTGRCGRGRGGALVALLAAIAGGAVAGAPPLLAQSASGPAERIAAEVDGGTVELHAVRHHGYPAVNLAELLGDFLTEVALDGGTARARLAGEELILRAGSPFLRFGGRVHQLANPPYLAGGSYWVPTEVVTHWWPSVREEAGLAVTGLAGPPGEPVPTANRRPGPWRVVIDAGHGGKDPGTRGRGGTREKDVVLDIARRVARLLESRGGFEPILTRDRDVFVDLRERSRFAIRREADLFLSVHANAAPDRRARGFETYFLGEARSEEARRVAMRENAALQFESNGEVGDDQIHDLEFILAGLDRSQWIRQSSRLGGFIQNALRGTQPGPDRGVKPGPYWVLVGASGSMPAVLVEVGFLSNADEERFLAGGTGRDRLARAIADAVADYFEDYGRRVGVTASGE